MLSISDNIVMLSISDNIVMLSEMDKLHHLELEYMEPKEKFCRILLGIYNDFDPLPDYEPEKMTDIEKKVIASWLRNQANTQKIVLLFCKEWEIEERKIVISWLIDEADKLIEASEEDSKGYFNFKWKKVLIVSHLYYLLKNIYNDYYYYST